MTLHLNLLPSLLPQGLCCHLEQWLSLESLLVHLLESLLGISM